MKKYLITLLMVMFLCSFALAGTKYIDDLTELTTPATGDQIAIDDISAGETKKIEVANLVQPAYSVDSSESDQGVDSGDSLESLITDIGSDEATVVFTNHDAASTTYTYTTTGTSAPQNVYFDFQNGAILDGVGTITIYSPDNIIGVSPGQQIFGSSITVNFTVGGTIHLAWQSSGAGTTASPYTGFEGLFSNGGGNVYKLCAGTWESTVGVTTITDSGITIAGAGRRITEWYFTATDASALLDFDASTAAIDNVHIRDISFYGSDPASATTGVATGAAIDTVRLQHSTFKNIDILYFNAGVGGGTSKGVKIMGDATANSYNLSFQNIYMFKTSIGFSFEDDGTSAYNADLININNFWFGAQDDTNDTYGIKVDGYLTNFSLTGINTIYHCKYGIYFNGTSGDASLVNWHIYNTKFEESGSYTSGVCAVFLKGDGAPGAGDYLRDISFSSCYFTANWTKQFDLDYVYSASIKDTHLLSAGTCIETTAHVDLTLSNIWHSGTFTIAAQKMFSIEGTSHINHAVYMSDRLSDWQNRFFDNLIRNTDKGEPTSGNEVLEASHLLGGLVDEDPEGSVNWTTDTAENIVAAIPGATVGDTFECILMNDATAASSETVTIASGTSVILHGSGVTLTEGTNETARLIFRLTNVTAGSQAVDCYILAGP